LALGCADEAGLYLVTRAMVVGGGALGLAVAAGAGRVIEGRAEATGMYDPNDLALVGVVVFPLAIWMLRDQSRLWRWVGAAAVVGALAAVTLTASRGGALGLGAVLLLLAVQYRKQMSPLKKLMAMAVVVAALVSAPATFWSRFKTLADPNADYNMTEETGRIALWKRGLGYFASRPLTGVGLGQFSTAEGAWAAQTLGTVAFKWSVAHSIWIQVLAETGLLGIVGFLGLYLPTLRDIRRTRARSATRAPPYEELRSFGAALGISIVGFFVAGTFLADAYEPAAMMLAALGMSFSYLVRQTMVPERRTKHGHSAGRLTAGLGPQ